MDCFMWGIGNLTHTNWVAAGPGYNHDAPVPTALSFYQETSTITLYLVPQSILTDAIGAARVAE